VPAEDDKSVGFILRYVNLAAHIAARVYSGGGAVNPKLSIVQVISLETELASVDIAISPGDTLTDVRVELVNNVVTFSWNGDSVSATLSSSILDNSVRHGIFTDSSATAANRGWIDNLIIEGLIL
jgi:hypothetical protein